jgi:DNA-binding PadR family transcriptional regulator
MEAREEIKNQYIEVCLKIETMEREYVAATAEWRALLREARKKRDALLSRIANGDTEYRFTPDLPFSVKADEHKE